MSISHTKYWNIIHYNLFSFAGNTVQTFKWGAPGRAKLSSFHFDLWHIASAPSQLTNHIFRIQRHLLIISMKTMKRQIRKTLHCVDSNSKFSCVGFTNSSLSSLSTLVHGCVREMCTLVFQTDKIDSKTKPFDNKMNEMTSEWKLKICPHSNEGTGL